MLFGQSIGAVGDANDTAQILIGRSASFNIGRTIGGWQAGTSVTGTNAAVQHSSSAMHIDCATGTEIYLNFYSEELTRIWGGLFVDGQRAQTTSEAGVHIGEVSGAYGIEIVSSVDISSIDFKASSGGAIDYQGRVLYDASVHDMLLSTNGAQRVAVNSDGIEVAGGVTLDNGSFLLSLESAATAAYTVTLPAAAPTAADQTLITTADFATTNTLEWANNAGVSGAFGATDVTTTTGRVGIGTASPSYPVEIINTESVAVSNVPTIWAASATSIVTQLGSPGVPMSLAVTGSIIVFGGGIYNSSDFRIKKNIEPISPSESLEIVRALQPVTFEHIDPTLGSGEHIGFIAQEVRRVCPSAVVEDGVPRYCPTVYKALPDTKRYRNANTANMRLIVKSGESTRTVDLAPGEELSIAEDEEMAEYGKEVDDFLSLQKDVLFTTNIAATQCLADRVDALETLVRELLSSRCSHCGRCNEAGE